MLFPSLWVELGRQDRWRWWVWRWRGGEEGDLVSSVPQDKMGQWTLGHKTCMLAAPPCLHKMCSSIIKKVFCAAFATYLPPATTLLCLPPYQQTPVPPYTYHHPTTTLPSTIIIQNFLTHGDYLVMIFGRHFFFIFHFCCCCLTDEKGRKEKEEGDSWTRTRDWVPCGGKGGKEGPSCSSPSYISSLPNATHNCMCASLPCFRHVYEQTVCCFALVPVYCLQTPVFMAWPLILFNHYTCAYLPTCCVETTICNFLI